MIVIYALLLALIVSGTLLLFMATGLLATGFVFGAEYGRAVFVAVLGLVFLSLGSLFGAFVIDLMREAVGG